MSGDDLNREIAFAGQRVKQKVIFALTLASVIPLLILTYAFQAPVRQILGPISQYTEAFTMPALLLFTGLLMAGGGFVVWDVASAISRAAHLATATRVADLPTVPARKDEIGTLMTSFAKMLATRPAGGQRPRHIVTCLVFSRPVCPPSSNPSARLRKIDT